MVIWWSELFCSITRQEKRVERAELPAPKVTPRAPVQTTVNPSSSTSTTSTTSSSTQPVPSSRPQPSAASTPATPSTPAPAPATIPAPAQVRIWLFVNYASTWAYLSSRWWDLLRIEGSEVVDWLALVLSLLYLSLSFSVSVFYLSALSHQSPEHSLLPRWALRLWDLRVWQDE